MIVRDESAVIERLLNSVRGTIDTWVICDTGSTDGTQRLIRHLLADIPGTLHETVWRDFGHNRTELVRLAEGKADYLLLLGADMVLVKQGELPSELTADRRDWRSRTKRFNRTRRRDRTSGRDGATGPAGSVGPTGATTSCAAPGGSVTAYLDAGTPTLGLYESPTWVVWGDNAWFVVSSTTSVAIGTALGSF
jgi:glycosyltransferase involved in cell wall biosynthesis